VQEVMGLIRKSHAVIPKGSKLVLSHHYGLGSYRHFGAAVFECFLMDEYAKKILVMLPGQMHQAHHHKRKHETFHVLWGDLFLTVGDKSYYMEPTDLVVVSPGMKHSFSTDKGCVFEEISTAADPSDSVYEIELSENRKTFVREF